MVGCRFRMCKLMIWIHYRGKWEHFWKKTMFWLNVWAIMWRVTSFILECTLSFQYPSFYDDQYMNHHMYCWCDWPYNKIIIVNGYKQKIQPIGAGGPPSLTAMPCWLQCHAESKIQSQSSELITSGLEIDLWIPNDSQTPSKTNRFWQQINLFRIFLCKHAFSLNTYNRDLGESGYVFPCIGVI